MVVLLVREGDNLGEEFGRTGVCLESFDKVNEGGGACFCP